MSFDVQIHGMPREIAQAEIAAAMVRGTLTAST